MERSNEHSPASEGQDDTFLQQQNPPGLNVQSDTNIFPEEMMAMLDNLDLMEFSFSPGALEDGEGMELDQYGDQPPFQNIPMNPFEPQPSAEQAGHPGTVDEQNIFQCGEGHGDMQAHQRLLDAPLAPPAPTNNRSSDHTTEQPAEAASQCNGITSSSYETPLPNGDFKLIVSLMRRRVIETNVNGQKGCVIFHPCPGKAVEEPALIRGQARLPIKTTTTTKKDDGTVLEEEINWMTASQERYTKRILSNMAGGLGLAADDSGNLYARRQCLAKVFWTSTQRDDAEAIELKRDALTPVFDASVFYESYKKKLGDGAVEDVEMRRPAIRFVFGQKWNVGSETFNTKLVTLRVEPLRENKQIEFALKRDIKNHSHFDSHHSGLILLSNPGEANDHLPPPGQ